MNGFQDTKIYRHRLRYENFLAVVTKNTVLWDVTPCSFVHSHVQEWNLPWRWMQHDSTEMLGNLSKITRCYIARIN